MRQLRVRPIGWLILNFACRVLLARRLCYFPFWANFGQGLDFAQANEMAAWLVLPSLPDVLSTTYEIFVLSLFPTTVGGGGHFCVCLLTRTKIVHTAVVVL